MSSNDRINWSAVLKQGRAIMEQYDTGVTLRQLFYRLVAAGTIQNTPAAYSYLSKKTAEARRRDKFPDFLDNSRRIRGGVGGNTDPARAVRSNLRTLEYTYSRNHSEYQEFTVVIGVEKATMTEQLWSWFSKYDFAVVALGGYASQSLVDKVADMLDRRDREAVLLYAGDFDPSGEDILRDFVARTDKFEPRCFEYVERIALSSDQVDEYDLPIAMGKKTDKRASGFRRRHGGLWQVELEAMDPDDLRDLYWDAVKQYWSEEAHQQSLDQEKQDKLEVRRMTREALRAVKNDHDDEWEW